MSTKDTPPHGGTTEEQLDNNDIADIDDLLERFVAYAIEHNPYKLLAMEDFEGDTFFVGDLDGYVEGTLQGVEGEFKLPADVRNDVLFIRIGKLLPSEEDAVIAIPSELAYDRLIACGFGFDRTVEDTSSDIDERLELEIDGHFRLNEGDIDD